MKIPKSPPALKGQFVSSTDPLLVLETLRQVDDSRYFHWDELTYQSIPEFTGYPQNRFTWWYFLKLRRSVTRRRILTPSGFFYLSTTDPIRVALRQVDRRCAGQRSSDAEWLDLSDPPRFLHRGRGEEAIESSLLEGAATTRQVAQEMLRKDRKPRSKGERMIHDNYAAMSWLSQEREVAITSETLCQLHRLLTQSTLKPHEVGQFESEQSKRVVIADRVMGQVLHTPPPVQEIAPHIAALCRLCNGEAEYATLHPVLRACLAHFWLAWLHPFADGNGRTARALFYWVMLKNGYWLLEHLSLSRLFKQAPRQYARAFLLTETDELDTTYFVRHHLKTLLKAITYFDSYAHKKVQAFREAERLLSHLEGLNHRQIALIQHALRHAEVRYTIKGHQRSHGVVYQTARTDLIALVERGLLVQKKQGRSYVFVGSSDMKERVSLGVKE